MTPRRLAFTCVLASAAALGACSTVGSTLGFGNRYETVSASPTTITLRYDDADENAAARRAQEHCQVHGRRAQLQRVTSEGDGRLASYDCVL